MLATPSRIAICVIFLVLCLALAPEVAFAALGKGAGKAVTAIVLAPFLYLTHFIYKKAKAPDIYTVYFGTNREKSFLSNYIASHAHHINYGKCNVAIPKSHKIGSTGSSKLFCFLKRLITRTDDRIIVADTTPLEHDSFYHEIASKTCNNENTILLYIHGYNSSFTSAITRGAQLGFDLNIKGITAVFAWPSKGNPATYLADEDAIEASVVHIQTFISEFCDKLPHAQINIIAHSMGNRGLIHALDRIALQHSNKVELNQIILAAPDINSETFKQIAHCLSKISKRTTLYVSSQDKALSASCIIHDSSRTGYTPPVTIIGGVDTIEASNIDVGILGHGYYAEASNILFDMYTLITTNTPPEKRIGLIAATSDEGGQYWVVRETKFQ